MNNNLVGFILAAGYSKRLKELTKDRPKSFLEIKGKKIIEYHLENLSNLGIKKTYIVVGFLKNIFKEKIGNQYKGMNISYIDNDEFETTGHGYSLYLGKDVFKRNKIILIFADLFCDPKIYSEALNSNFENVMIIEENYPALTGEESLAQGEDEVMFGLGLNKKEKVQGVYIGISKFNQEFLAKLCDYMGEFFERENKKLNCEILIGKFLEDTKFKINYKKLNGKKWININYPVDYERAKSLIETN